MAHHMIAGNRRLANRKEEGDCLRYRIKETKKKKARRCTIEVLTLMEDRLEVPRCTREGIKKI